ncbi:hypothetical protein EV401DRAFT_1986807 [Pisolithus croceorrhizus]|nr:hypothetical protein EV401DRAFT_1986807 [Pisolithus croceorrhizus]
MDFAEHAKWLLCTMTATSTDARHFHSCVLESCRGDKRWAQHEFKCSGRLSKETYVSYSQSPLRKCSVYKRMSPHVSPCVWWQYSWGQMVCRKLDNWAFAQCHCHDDWGSPVYSRLAGISLPDFGAVPSMDAQTSTWWFEPFVRSKCYSVLQCMPRCGRFHFHVLSRW